MANIVQYIFPIRWAHGGVYIFPNYVYQYYIAQTDYMAMFTLLYYFFRIEYRIAYSMMDVIKVLLLLFQFAASARFV